MSRRLRSGENREPRLQRVAGKVGRCQRVQVHGSQKPAPKCPGQTSNRIQGRWLVPFTAARPGFRGGRQGSEGLHPLKVTPAPRPAIPRGHFLERPRARGGAGQPCLQSSVACPPGAGRTPRFRARGGRGCPTRTCISEGPCFVRTSDRVASGSGSRMAGRGVTVGNPPTRPQESPQGNHRAPCGDGGERGADKKVRAALSAPPGRPAAPAARAAAASSPFARGRRSIPAARSREARQLPHVAPRPPRRLDRSTARTRSADRPGLPCRSHGSQQY